MNHRKIIDRASVSLQVHDRRMEEYERLGFSRSEASKRASHEIANGDANDEIRASINRLMRSK